MFNGEKINELLKTKNIKVRDFLDYLRVGPKTTSIGSIVRGNPSASRLEAIADYLEISIDDLFIREKKYEKSKVQDTIVSYTRRPSDFALINKLIAEKDQRIQSLERNNELLSRALDKFVSGQIPDK